MNTTLRTIARLAATTAAVATMTFALAGTSHADGGLNGPTGGPGFGDPTHDLPAHTLFLNGTIDGTLDNAKVTCTKLADSAWAWTATGTVDGKPVELTFNTNHYKGAGTYNTTGITDTNGGLATLDGDNSKIIAVTDGATVGTFVVNDDELGGTIDTTLDNNPATDHKIHVTGGWSCA